MADDTQSTAPVTTAQKSVAAKAAERVQLYADLVSPNVSAAQVGLKKQLEDGAKNRLTFGS